MAVLDVIYISNYECGSHLAFACCAIEQILKLNTRTVLGQLSNLMSVKEVTLDGNYTQSLIWGIIKAT